MCASCLCLLAALPHRAARLAPSERKGFARITTILFPLDAGNNSSVCTGCPTRLVCHPERRLALFARRSRGTGACRKHEHTRKIGAFPMTGSEAHKGASPSHTERTPSQLLELRR